MEDKNILTTSRISWRSVIIAPEKSKAYLVILPNKELGYDTLAYELAIMNYYTKENSENGVAFWQTYYYKNDKDNGYLPAPILWADVNIESIIGDVINGYTFKLIEQEKNVKVTDKILEAEKSLEVEKINKITDADSEKIIDNGICGEVGEEVVIG